ncbi:MAG TPA: sterol desaturase family protein [Steroidobacteraceae bacterium]|nr:sterol desaturase family protein [Steroidobacteraceae bacterium]
MIAVILAAFAACFIVESAVPGWKLPAVRTWPLRVLSINAVQLCVVLLAGVSWERWLRGASLCHLSRHVPPLIGGFIAYFIATFVFYWWHRWRHEHDSLWRFFHQIHHSPQRIEVITSFYKHPGEMAVNSVIGSILVYTLLGLSPAAGGIYTACTALGEFFYHTSIKTPAGWDSFFSARRCTASITNIGATAITTAISRGGICCSELMKTRKYGPAAVDSTMPRSKC